MSREINSAADLRQIEIDILRALTEHDGQAKSVELRKYLGIDKAEKFNYRVREILEPAGYVTTAQQKVDPGKIPPNTVTMTSEGRQLLQRENLGEGKQIAERLDRLESQVEALRTENKDLRERNEELAAAVRDAETDQLIQDVDQLIQDVDQLNEDVKILKNSDLHTSLGVARQIDKNAIKADAAIRYIKGWADEDNVDELLWEIEQNAELVNSGASPLLRPY